MTISKEDDKNLRILVGYTEMKITLDVLENKITKKQVLKLEEALFVLKSIIIDIKINE